jgi:hypothetical protein
VIKAYYASHNTGAHREGAVVLLDDEVPEQYGLTQTGYYVQLKTPERADGEVQGEDRAG